MKDAQEASVCSCLTWLARFTLEKIQTQWLTMVKYEQCVCERLRRVDLHNCLIFNDNDISMIVFIPF